jgi:DinB superfamily
MDFYLLRLQNGIATATEGMSVESLLRHPEGKWCAAEILEHLYLTYTGTIKGFQRCLDGGKPLARVRTWSDRVRTLVVVGLNHLPEGRVSPRNASPRGLALEQVLAELPTKIAAMDDIIALAEEKYGQHTRLLDHPILGPLQGREWRKFHWVHGQHHLKQIDRLKDLGSA